MHIRAPEQCKGVHPGPKYAIEFPMPTCDATQRRAVNLSKKTLLVHSLLSSPIFFLLPPQAAHSAMDFLHAISPFVPYPSLCHCFLLPTSASSGSRSCSGLPKNYFLQLPCRIGITSPKLWQNARPLLMQKKRG